MKITWTVLIVGLAGLVTIWQWRRIVAIWTIISRMSYSERLNIFDKTRNRMK